MITFRTIQSALKTIKNAAMDPKEFVMEGFLEPGLVSYMDSNAGICLLRKEAIDKMLASFVGCPVTIDHIEESKENAGAKKKGQVTKAWYNEKTGKYDCSFTVEDTEAEKKVKAGWSGSCAYNVTETGPGGEWHAMKFQEEIMNGQFEHLALVTNPRYEDCKIKMNSKDARIVRENATVIFENAKSFNVKENSRIKIQIDPSRSEGKGKVFRASAYFDGRYVLQTGDHGNAKAAHKEALDAVLGLYPQLKEENIEVKEMKENDVLSKEQITEMVKDAHSMSEEQWTKKYPIGDYQQYASVTVENAGGDASRLFEVIHRDSGKTVGRFTKREIADKGIKSDDFVFQEVKENATTADLMRIVQGRQEGHEEAAKKLKEMGVLLPYGYDVEAENGRENGVGPNKGDKVRTIDGTTGSVMGWDNGSPAYGAYIVKTDGGAEIKVSKGQIASFTKDSWKESKENTVTLKNGPTNYQYATILMLIKHRSAAEIAEMIGKGLELGQLSSQEAEALRTKVVNNSTVTLKKS